jgi:hypothetical protein
MQVIAEKEPWGCVLVDYLMMPEAETGEIAILTMTDLFTRYTEMYAAHETSSEEACKALMKNILHRHGEPIVIQTDHGSHFQKDFTGMLEERGITHHMTHEYMAQGMGRAERTHMNIAVKFKTALPTSMTRLWPELLQEVQFHLNNAPNRHLGDMSSYQALYGRVARTRYDLAVGYAPSPFTRDQWLDIIKAHHDYLQIESALTTASEKKIYDESRVVVDFPVDSYVKIFFPSRAHKLDSYYRNLK